MADGGGEGASGAEGHVAEEDAEDDAPQAHHGDAGPGLAGIARAVVVAQRHRRCVPQAPDDARNQHGGHHGQPRGHFRHEVAAPAPFLAEGGEEVERRRDGALPQQDEHEQGRVGRRRIEGGQGLGANPASRGRLALGREEGRHARVEVAGEHEEVHGGAGDHEQQRPEPGHGEPGQRLPPGPRFQHAVPEPLPRDQAREHYAQGREEHGERHGRHVGELRREKLASVGRRALGDGVHHGKVVGVGDAEGDGEEDEGAFHGGSFRRDGAGCRRLTAGGRREMPDCLGIGAVTDQIVLLQLEQFMLYSE